MNVAILLYGTSIEGGGGAERRFVRVFEKFNHESYQIFLIVNRSLYNSLYSLGYILDSNNIKIIEDALFFKNLIFNFKLIKLLFSNKEIDILHLVLIQKYLTPFYLFLWLYRNKNFKVVSTVPSYFLAYRKDISLIKSISYYLYIKASNHIDSLYPNIILKNKKYSITPCPFTDYSLFSPGVKENIVLFAGRLTNYKNPIVFVKAVIHLLENNKVNILNDWRFIVCGSGPLEKKMKQYISKKGYENYIQVKKCPDVHELMGKSKIFVSLQTYENYPSQSLIEAIVTQNNIIVTDVGDTRLLFKTGVAHFISLNPTELSNKLLEVMVNGGFSQNLLKETSENFQDKNNVEIFKEYLLNIWNEVYRKQQ